MNYYIFIPASLRAAGAEIRDALEQPLFHLSREKFVRAWSALAYLFPGLHPDDIDVADSGWSPVLKRFAIEAWRRADTGELADEELYPSDAQWAGIYDLLNDPTPEEAARRTELAARSSKYSHA